MMRAGLIVRMIDSDAASLSNRKGKYSDLFADAQKVINELQQIVQPQQKDVH